VQATEICYENEFISGIKRTKTDMQIYDPQKQQPSNYPITEKPKKTKYTA